MPKSKKRSYSRYTLAATELLGQLIAIERKSRKMTALDLASRLGVDRDTLARLERGDPKVEIGVGFEACAILGIPLFEEDLKGLTARIGEAATRLALLPKRMRQSKVEISDDF
jgi:transcriptional regulator with XRE-family HTH domain